MQTTANRMISRILMQKTAIKNGDKLTAIKTDDNLTAITHCYHLIHKMLHMFLYCRNQ